jgi:hypothetical protein
MPRVDLIQTYISGLNLTEIAIVGAGKQCRIKTTTGGRFEGTFQTGEIAPGEPVAHRYFFKSSHVDLLLATIGQDGLSGRSAAALAASIEQAAASIGAVYRSPAEIHKAAELAVAAITERVRIANQSGGMKSINREYRAYRQQQLAKGEMATSYAAFIEPFVATMVKRAAARMI